jgi:hypothetical protein
MGKRELLIALAFVVVGVVAFRFAAPPAETRDTGFSLAKLITNARRGMKGDETYSAPARTVTYAITPDITDLRVEGINGSIKITGETRNDITVQLKITSTGETEAAAVAIADKVHFIEDRVGSTLALRMWFPPEKTQTATVVFLVPARLALRLDAPRDAVVSTVKSLEFLNPARGATELTAVGEVRGDQSNGVLTMSAIGSAKMTLTRVRARISDMGAASLDVRDGQTEISASHGLLEIEERRGDVLIRDHQGRIKVSGSDGQVRIEGATDEVNLDLRRAEVNAELAVGAAGSIVTSNEALHVSIAEPGNVRMDAVAVSGTIDGTSWNLTPATTGDDSRVDAALGTKGGALPRVSLRNSDGEIVIRKSSKK